MVVSLVGGHQYIPPDSRIILILGSKLPLDQGLGFRVPINLEHSKVQPRTVPELQTSSGPVRMRRKLSRP